MPARLTLEEKEKRAQEKSRSKEITKIKKDCLERILKPNVLNNFTFPREHKIINKVFDNFPNIDFWRGFNLDFKLNSAAWLLTENGNDYLIKEYRRQTTDLSALTRREEQPQLINETIEKIEIIKKPLTLKDFLK